MSSLDTFRAKYPNAASPEEDPGSTRSPAEIRANLEQVVERGLAGEYGTTAGVGAAILSKSLRRPATVTSSAAASPGATFTPPASTGLVSPSYAQYSAPSAVPVTVDAPGAGSYASSLLAGRNYIGDISSGWGIGDRNRGTGLNVAGNNLTNVKW